MVRLALAVLVAVIIGTFGYGYYLKQSRLERTSGTPIVASSKSLTSEPAPIVSADPTAEVSAYIQGGAKGVLSPAGQKLLQGVIQESVVGRLKDPASVQFRDLGLARNGESPEARYNLCGSVNAKNSFGGYTGFQRFVSDGSAGGPTFEPVTNDSGLRENFENYWRYAGCSQ